MVDLSKKGRPDLGRLTNKPFTTAALAARKPKRSTFLRKVSHSQKGQSSLGRSTNKMSPQEHGPPGGSKWSTFLRQVDRHLVQPLSPQELWPAGGPNWSTCLERSTFLRKVDQSNVTPGEVAARRPTKVDLSWKGRPTKMSPQEQRPPGSPPWSTRLRKVILKIATR